MKLKKIRNALLVVLTLALVSATAVAITWAYVENSFGSKTNVFTNDDIVAELTENEWDGHYPKNSSSYRSNWDDPLEIKDHQKGQSKYNTEATYTWEEEGKPDLTVPGDHLLGMNIAASYTYETEIPKNPSITNISDLTKMIQDPEYPDDNTKKIHTPDPTEWVAMTVRYYIPATEEGVNYKYYFDGYNEFKTALASIQNDANAETPFNTGSGNTNWTAKNTAGNKDYTVFYYNSKLNNYATTATVFDQVTINEQSAFDALKVTQTMVDEATAANNAVLAAELTDNLGNYRITGLIKYNADTKAYVNKDETLYLEALPEFHIELQGYAIQGDLYTENGAEITDITTQNAENKTVKDLLDAMIAQDPITIELEKAYVVTP